MYPWIIVDSSSNTVSISRTDWPLIWRPAMTTALSITIEGSSCCWETTNLSSVWCWKNSAHDFGHFRAMIPASNFPSELHFLPTCSSKENSKMICNMHELEYVYAEEEYQISRIILITEGRSSSYKLKIHYIIFIF